VRARDGKRVWRFRDGKYANPVVVDEERVYVTGQSHQYALAPRRAAPASAGAKGDRAERARRASKRAGSRDRAGAG
jgi:hypothetical protein